MFLLCYKEQPINDVFGKQTSIIVRTVRNIRIHSVERKQNSRILNLVARIKLQDVKTFKLYINSLVKSLYLIKSKVKLIP
jgi:hypothetical protein